MKLSNFLSPASLVFHLFPSLAMKKYLIGGSCVAALLLVFFAYRTASVPSVPLDAAAVPTYGYSCLCKVPEISVIVPKPADGCDSLALFAADDLINSCSPATPSLINCQDDPTGAYGLCLCWIESSEKAVDFPEGTSTSEAQEICEEKNGNDCGSYEGMHLQCRYIYSP